jgi:hypothetical protein
VPGKRGHTLLADRTPAPHGAVDKPSEGGLGRAAALQVVVLRDVALQEVVQHRVAGRPAAGDRVPGRPRIETEAPAARILVGIDMTCPGN